MDTAGFAARLKYARERRGVGSYALSRAIGRGGSYVSMIETGARLRDAFPAADVLERMATTLEVSVGYLLGRESWPGGVPRSLAEPQALYTVEPIGALLDRLGVQKMVDPVGQLEEFGASLGDDDRRTRLPQDIEYSLPKRQRGKRGAQYRAIVAHGQCMNGAVPDGSVVLFEDHGHAEPGALVVAVLDGEQVMVKRLVEDDGERYLVSEQGHRYHVNGDVRLVGPVRLVMQRF
jgi:transcriptional regulator with XRE-family HTH domain